MRKLGEGRKVAASLILVVFIVLATLFEFALFNIKMREECWGEMRSDAQNMRSAVDGSMQGTVLGLRNMAEKVALTTDDDEIISIVGEAIVGLTQASVRVYLPGGTAIVDGEYVDYSSFFSYTDIYAEKEYISEMHKDSLGNGEEVVEQFVPIKRGNRVIGMMSAVIELAKFGELDNRGIINRDDKFIILDRRNGDILVDTQNNVTGNINNGIYKSGKVLGDYSREEWFDDIMTGRESRIVIKSRLTGETSCSYGIPFEETPWEMIILIDRDDFMNRYSKIKITVYGVLIVEAVALAIYLIWMLRITENQIRSENSRYDGITKVISEGYDYIYYVNIKNNSYTDFSQNGFDKDGNRIGGKDFFKFAYNKFIPVIPREDRATIERYLNKEELLKALSNNEIISTMVRFVTGGELVFYRVKALKDGVNSNNIVIAIENIDNSQRQKDEIERISNIVKTLSNDYTSVFTADLESDKSITVFLSERYEEVLSNFGFTETDSFSDRMNLINDELIHPDDRDSFINTVLGEEIKEKISSGSTVYVDFRAGIGGNYRHNTLKFVPNIGASSLSVVVGARDTEREYNEQMAEKQRLIEQQKLIEDVKYTSIIAGLSDEYDYVGHLDYETGILERLHINPQMEQRLSEYVKFGTEFEAAKMFFMDYLYPEDVHSFFEVIEKNCVVKVLSSKPIFSYDFRMSIGGEINYYRLRIAKESNKSSAIIVGLINIDDEVRAEMRQKEQEKYIHNMEFMSMLSDQMVAVFEVNIETGFYDVFSMNGLYNEKVLSKFVRTNDFFEDIKKNVCSPLPEEDIELCLRNLSRACMMRELANKNFYEWTYKVLTPEGEYKWYKERVTYTDSEKKNVVIGIFDINEYKMTQNLITTYQQDAVVYGRAILSNAHTYYKINLSNDMVVSDVIERVNGKPVDYSGKFGDTMPPYTSVLRQSAENYVDEEYMESYQFYLSPTYLISCYMDGNMKPEYICRIYSTVLGWHYRKYVNYLSVDSQTGDYLSMVVAYDVTEEMERQKQLSDALELAQSANRAKTTFLNNMSHDIRTPMNAIIGFTSLAENHIDNKEQTVGYLHKINQSSQHLLSLINDVLDMSRIESGKVSLDEKEENLADIMHSLRNMIQSDITSNNLKLVADLIDVEHENVICDKLKLNQILINVISNSVKYTKNGGTIYIELKEYGVSNIGYGEYEFKIRDTGIGMSEEYIDSIFDPFTREKSATVSGIQGSGLGMAITKNIVDMMGGKISVSSQKGVGSEFTIKLSLKVTEEDRDKLPEGLDKINVLIVNGESAVCRNISGMLKNLGLKSDYCLTWEEALLKVDEAEQLDKGYNLIMLNDVIDNDVALNKVPVLREHTDNQCRIVIMSADDFTDDEERAQSLGVYDYLPKPIFLSDIRSMILKNHLIDDESANDDTDCFAGCSVLLVEDNELNREIAQELLEERGFHITIAVDGTEAVEIMKNAKPGDFDIVLMDIQMPVMDGYEATGRIRKLTNGTQNIPIVAMTANAFEEDRKAAMDAGMNEHISKPINIPMLQSVLLRFVKNDEQKE